MTEVLYGGIIILCLVLAGIQIRQGHMEALTKILFRLTGGVIGIWCTNAILGLFGGGTVGLNLFTLSVLGGLGLPGVILLYLLVHK